MTILSYHPSFEFESLYAGPVAGVDEAGIGSWIGPVMAAAVILNPDVSKDLLSQLNDSKKLSEKKRDHIFSVLQESPHVHMGIGEASLEEIESLNIRRAGLLAMKRAVESLSLTPTMVLVDGTGEPDMSTPIKTIIKGDQRSYSIAAASIIAKVTRDRWVQSIACDYPGYGFEKNAGYGTKQHQEALEIQGVTHWHRRSYAPIAALLSSSIR
jgi:ribonuclease HII